MTSSTFVVPPFDYSISIIVAGFKYAKKEPRTIQSEVLSQTSLNAEFTRLFCSIYNAAVTMKPLD